MRHPTNPTPTPDHDKPDRWAQLDTSWLNGNPDRCWGCDDLHADPGNTVGLCVPCLERLTTPEPVDHPPAPAPVGTAAYWADVDEADTAANLPNRPAPPGWFARMQAAARARYGLQ